MGNIRSLTIQLNSNVSSAMQNLGQPLARLQNIESAADRVNASLGSIKGPEVDKGSAGLGDAGPKMAAQISGPLSGALTAALAPLQGIATKLGAQFNAVAGTITTLARRIDTQLRATRIEADLRRAKMGFTALGLAAAVAAVKIGAAMSNPLMWIGAGLLGAAFIKVFPKIADAANRAASKISTFFLMSGDVSKKAFDKMSNVGLGKPIQAAGNFAKVMSGPVTSSIQHTTNITKKFGSELLVALGVFGLGYKVVEFFKGGIKGAINLNETVSKTKEVFGESTDVVVAQADKMAKAFGLPKGAMLDAASSFGAIASGSGLADAASAKMANTLVKLAADASSLYNVPLPEAMAKIQAGLRGSYEPMLGLNVQMSEQAVQQEAVRLGLIKGKQALDDRTKIVARASLMETKLAVASGDLEKTQGGAANQFRKAGGGLDNFATSIGTILLPAVTTGITVFNELQSSIIEMVEANKPAIESFANGIKSGFEVIGVIVRNFGMIWEITLIKIQEFVTNAGALFQTFGPNIATIFGWIGSNIWTMLGDLWRGVYKFFTSLIGNIGKMSKAFFAGEDLLAIDFEPLLDGFKATFDKMPELVKPGLISMQKEIDVVAGKIADKEAKRASEMVKLGARAKRPGEIAKAAETNTPDYKSAGAFVAGSKEAYSAIVQANGQQGNDPIKEVAANSRGQLEAAREANRLFKALYDATIKTKALEVLAL